MNGADAVAITIDLESRTVPAGMYNCLPKSQVADLRKFDGYAVDIRAFAYAIWRITDG